MRDSLTRGEIIKELYRIGGIYIEQCELVRQMSEILTKLYISELDMLYSKAPKYPYNATSIAEMEDFYRQCKEFDAFYSSIADGEFKNKVLSSAKKQISEWKELEKDLESVTIINKSEFYIATRIAIKMQDNEMYDIHDAIMEIYEEEREKQERNRRF